MGLQLVIGNKAYSSWSLRPWLLLTQFGIPFEEVRLVLRSPDWSTRMAAWSPAGKVPVLKDGELAIWDSLAIAEYLNETWLDGRGWPAARAARALARCVVSEMHAGFGALRSELPMNLRREGRAPARPSAVALADIARVQQIWSDSLASHGGPFLFGEFGIADAFFAPVLTRFRSYAVALANPTIAGYSQRMLELPALRQWYAQAAAESEVIADYEQA